MALTLYKRIDIEDGKVVGEDELLLLINESAPIGMALDRDKARLILEIIEYLTKKQTIDNEIDKNGDFIKINDPSIITKSNITIQLGTPISSISYITPVFSVHDFLYKDFATVCGKVDGLKIQAEVGDRVKIDFVINNLWR